MPRGPFTTESKKSDLKAASSGRSFAVRRKLSFSERTALKNSCHPMRRLEKEFYQFELQSGEVRYQHYPKRKTTGVNLSKHASEPAPCGDLPEP